MYGRGRNETASEPGVAEQRGEGLGVELMGQAFKVRLEIARHDADGTRQKNVQRRIPW
jgi:hypothetical protein